MSQKHVIHSTYFNIKQEIWNKITAGEYQPGARLPSIAQLAEQYGVSDRTVHQAINELAWEGIVKVAHGKGTFVALPKLEYDLLKDFSEQTELLGGGTRTEIYNTRWVAPEPNVIKLLGIRSGQDVWEVEKLHYLDEIPVMVESSLFPKRLAQEAMDNMQKLRSVFQFLENDMNCTNLDVTVSSVKITSERMFADLLHIPYKPYRTTFYQYERLICSDDRPLLLSFHILRSDKFQLRFHAQRRNGLA